MGTSQRSVRNTSSYWLVAQHGDSTSSFRPKRRVEQVTGLPFTVELAVA